MKVALLADIHGNADALRPVLSEAREERVVELLIAGDLVGYYYDTDRVLALLNDWTWRAVLGNHEELLRQWRQGRNRIELHRRFGSAPKETGARLSAAILDRLEALPHPLRVEIAQRRVLLCHGAPWDINAYVYPDAPLEQRNRMAETGYDLVVFGHTRYPVVWENGRTLVVNPGSIGQTRDRIPGACWALWDTDGHRMELRRTPYDPQRLCQKCRQRDPHLPYLADVLTRTE